MRKKSEILVSDLRKDNKLKRKAQNTLADLGLFSDSDQSASDSSVSSDSSDILNFTEPLKTHGIARISFQNKSCIFSITLKVFISLAHGTMLDFKRFTSIYILQFN